MYLQIRATEKASLWFCIPRRTHESENIYNFTYEENNKNKIFMYKMVFRYFLIFRKLKIGRVEVETGRRSSHSPLALIRAKLRPQIGGPDVDGIGVVDVGVGV
jgi:hypothetical protein